MTIDPTKLTNATIAYTYRQLLFIDQDCPSNANISIHNGDNYVYKFTNNAFTLMYPSSTINISLFSNDHTKRSTFGRLKNSSYIQNTYDSSSQYDCIFGSGNNYINSTNNFTFNTDCSYFNNVSYSLLTVSNSITAYDSARLFVSVASNTYIKSLSTGFASMVVAAFDSTLCYNYDVINAFCSQINNIRMHFGSVASYFTTPTAIQSHIKSYIFNNYCSTVKLSQKQYEPQYFQTFRESCVLPSYKACVDSNYYWCGSIGGLCNSIKTDGQVEWASIITGYCNCLDLSGSGNFRVIDNGYKNTILHNSSVCSYNNYIYTGQCNILSGGTNDNTIYTGCCNKIIGSTVGAEIFNGCYNTSYGGCIFTGLSNIAYTNLIFTGANNYTNSGNSFLVTGQDNKITVRYSTLFTGISNIIPTESVLFTGVCNNSYYSYIFSGRYNTITSGGWKFNQIFTGEYNKIIPSGQYCILTHTGKYNTLNSYANSTIFTGISNNISGNCIVVIGSNNTYNNDTRYAATLGSNIYVCKWRTTNINNLVIKNIPTSCSDLPQYTWYRDTSSDKLYIKL